MSQCLVCAAGKGTFSTEEISLSVQEYNLNKIVDHHTLILPQPGATGVGCAAEIIANWVNTFAGRKIMAGCC